VVWVTASLHTLHDEREAARPATETFGKRTMESMPLASREEADGINTSLALISSQSYEHAALRLDIDSRVLLDIRKGHGIEKHLPGSVNAQLVQALTQQIINPYLIYGRRVLAFLREPHRGLDVSALHLPQRPPPSNPSPPRTTPGELVLPW
jgi:hypothetical protein